MASSQPEPTPSGVHVDLKPYLERLVSRTPLSVEEAGAVAEAIAQGQTEGMQTAALLSLLAGVGESADVVYSFASTLRRHATHVAHAFPALLDIVGTGGDGHNSINISTASAIVAASCGVKIAKHGSISVSSRSGSADVLQALGISFLPATGIAPCIEACGIAFMFAPHFHPALKHVVPVRKALKIRTIFNILGPLLNPAGATRLVLGVYQPRLLAVYAEAVRRLDVDHALIVHCCGLDELAPVGPTQAIEVKKGSDGVCVCTDVVYEPLEWGVKRCSIEDLEGGSPQENADILVRLLSGFATLDDEPKVDAIALNAGAAVYVYGLAPSLEAGYHMALEALKSGKPHGVLTAWADFCKHASETTS